MTASHRPQLINLTTCRIEETLLFLDIGTIPNSNLPGFLPAAGSPTNSPKSGLIAPAKKEIGQPGGQEQLTIPYLLRLRSITVAMDVDTEPAVLLARDEIEERAMLEQFWGWAARHKPIVCYKVLGDGLPQVLWRSMMLGVTPSRILNIGRDSKDVLDLLLLLHGGDVQTEAMPGMTLKQICNLLGIPDSLPDATETTVDTMSDDEARQYAVNAMELLQSLYRWMAGVYFEP